MSVYRGPWSSRQRQASALLIVSAILLGCAQPVPTGPPPTLSSTVAPPPATIQGATPTSPATASAMPSAGLSISPLGLDTAAVPMYEPVQVTFDVAGAAATNLDFPYDPDPPPGLMGRVGISVEGLFLPPGETDWGHAVIQPAFRYQDYQRVIGASNVEALTPIGPPTWQLRFAPTRVGAWQVMVRAQDASVCPEDAVPCDVWVESAAVSFVAADPLPGQHGFIRVSERDPRYFEYSDGTLFRVAGFQDELGIHTNVDEQFASYASNGITLLRGWMSATAVFSRGYSQWAAWTDSELDWNVHVPGHDVSARLDAGSSAACIFQGFGESARAAFFSGRTYQLTVRARIDGGATPRDPGRPSGLVVRLGGWPKDQCDAPQAGDVLLSPYWAGNGEWADYTTTFELDHDVVLDGSAYLTVALENAVGGKAYIDSVIVADSPGGPNVLPHGNLNDHLGFDQAASWRWDQVLKSAQAHGLALKLVVMEKQDSILGYIRPDGSIAPERDDANFYGLAGQESKVRRLQEYFWRYLTARWGASTAVHSWELVNEGDPFNGNHYDLANAFARAVHKTDPNHHLVTTSFWHSFPVKEFWGNAAYPDIDYADFHAYVDTTWLTPEDFTDPALTAGCGDDIECFKRALVGDSALYHLTHSEAVEQADLKKPVIRGEGSLTLPGSQQVSDPDLMRDTQGVWLHKLLFSQLDAGAVQELYWYNDEMRANDLYGIFARYRDFLEGVDLNAGGWSAAEILRSDDQLRVVGQFQAQQSRAVLWIDNAAHTWRAVVNGQIPATVSTRVTLAGFAPGSTLRVQWWSLCSGEAPTCRISIESEQIAQVDGSGSITLDVSDLATDVGVKLDPVP